MNAVEMVLRYLRGTNDVDIFFLKENNMQVIAYFDSDWMQDLDGDQQHESSSD